MVHINNVSFGSHVDVIINRTRYGLEYNVIYDSPRHPELHEIHLAGGQLKNLHEVTFNYGISKRDVLMNWIAEDWPF